MIAKVKTSYISGIHAYPIEVEVDASHGLPALSIVGLPDVACRESQDRVRSAIRNSGFLFPQRKVTVNLAPADVRKEGAAFDLPIAIGILAASEQIGIEGLQNCVFTGELSLDGDVRSVRGVLCRLSPLLTSNVKFIFPRRNLHEASCVDDVRLHPVSSLSEAIKAIAEPTPTIKRAARTRKPQKTHLDFNDVKGQIFARRGIEVACAGGHNLLMIGPPGAGKTMLAKRIPTVLSKLSSEEAVETTKIHSVVGLLKARVGLVEEPPFRAPHHTISDSAMVGGGTYPKPGEISLAHHGILFLDELPEFRRNVLEALRQPLEEGGILVARAAETVLYPARFMLVCAMNPCPCGYFSDEKRECHCSPSQIRQYMNKISGPLLDRIDLHLEVQALTRSDFNRTIPGENSNQIRDKVTQARQCQRTRYGNPKMLNARLEGRDTERFCELTQSADKFLKRAIEELQFSGRAYHKILKISRTIADLDQAPLIEEKHVQEAVQYRSLDRSYWFN